MTEDEHVQQLLFEAFGERFTIDLGSSHGTRAWKFRKSMRRNDKVYEISFLRWLSRNHATTEIIIHERQGRTHDSEYYWKIHYRQVVPAPVEDCIPIAKLFYEALP